MLILVRSPRRGFPSGVAGLSPRSSFSEDSMRGLEMRTSNDRRVMVTPQTANIAALVQWLRDAGLSNDELQLPDAMDVNNAAFVQQLRDAGLNVVSNSGVQLESINRLVERYQHAALRNFADRNMAMVHLIRGIIDHIPGTTPVIIAADNLYGHEVGDGAVVAAGGWRSHSHLMDPPQHERQFTPLEVGDGVATPSVHSEPSAINIDEVGDGDMAAAGGGRNGGGGANNPFWRWLRRESSSTWWLLGTGDINILKAGSFAPGLIPFFVDKQPPLNAQDAIYVRTAFWWGVSAFVIEPWRVPDAESTRLARNRQGIAVIILITGALIFMVTAVDEKLRLVLLSLSYPSSSLFPSGWRRGSQRTIICCLRIQEEVAQMYRNVHLHRSASNIYSSLTI